jgi:hypothetical protein
MISSTGCCAAALTVLAENGVDALTEDRKQMAYAFVPGGVLAALAKTSAELNLANGCAATPAPEGVAAAPRPASLRPLGGTISITPS